MNNLPEIKSLKIVESELESTKLEYEKLLIDRENLTNKITRAKKDNSKLIIIYNKFEFLNICY